jgi:hypothetical protein
MRRLLSLPVLLILMLLPAAIAGASPPTRQAVPDFEPFVVSGNCAFDVQVVQLRNDEVTATFDDGRQLTTGQLRVELINTASGAAIAVNVSGPVTFTPNADGTFTAIYHGRSLIFPNAPEPEQHIFWVTSGRVVMTVSNDSTVFSLLNVVGSTLDVCAAIGGP